MSTEEEDSIFSDEFMDSFDDPFGSVHIKKTFLYKGVRYKVPISTVDNEYQLGKITLSLNGYTCTTEKANQLLFSNISPDQILRIKCEEEDWSPCDEEMNDIYAFVYKEGKSDPVETGEGLYFKGGDILMEIETTGRRFEPGNYFIYFPFAKAKEDPNMYDRINKGLCYSFQIFRIGKGMDCPKPQLVSAIAENASNQSGRMKIAIDLSDGVRETCELSVICYDADFSLMARTDKIVTVKSTASHRISFYLDSYKIWTPGHYCLVMSRNRFPYAIINMDTTDFSHITCETEKLGPDNFLHWIVSMAEYGRWENWEAIREFRGLKREKFKIAQLYKSFYQDKCAERRRSSDLIVIESSNLSHSKQLATALDGLFKMGRESVTMIDLNPEETDETKSHLCLQGFSHCRKNNVYTFLNVQELLSLPNTNLLNDVLDVLENPEDKTTLVLCCTPMNLKTLSKILPNITTHLKESQTIHLGSMGPIEKVNELLYTFHKNGCRLTKDAEKKLVKAVLATHQEQGIQNIGDRDTSNWIDHVLMEGKYRKVQRTPIYTIEVGEIDWEDFFKKNPPQGNGQIIDKQAMMKEFNRAMTTLNNMTGLKNLKRSLTETFKKVMFSKQRKMLGLPACLEPPHHMLFLGNPGTGKTTVAKLIGQIYKSMGLLSKGDVIVTERDKLVGVYIGETEQKMLNLLEAAKGKVLFIDEAYTLLTTEDDRKDYGNQVINSLLTVLSQPHADMLIIMAGYEDEIERLLNKNHGLKSRFTHRYLFEDYTSDELFEIAQKELTNGFFTLSPEAEFYLKEIINHEVANKSKDFGNARWVLQLVNSGILPAMANRVIDAQTTCSIELYSQITKEDVLKAVDFVKELNENKTSGRIGFVR